MTVHAYISEIAINTQSSLVSLAGAFNATTEGHIDRKHKLLWSLFPGDAEAQRDFLWRELSDGKYLVVSKREPKGNELLQISKISPFAPKAQVGDLLHFTVQFAACKALRDPADIRIKGVRGKKVCLLEYARNNGIEPIAAAREWLARQGEKNGFALTDDFSLDRTAVQRIRKGTIRGTFEVTGTLKITDTQKLIEFFPQGLGTCKAFGFGMMLLKPVRSNVPPVAA